MALGRSSLELWRELEHTVPGGVRLIELGWIGPGGSGGEPIRQARVNPLRALASLAAAVPSIATGTAATSVKRQRAPGQLEQARSASAYTRSRCRMFWVRAS